MTIEKLRSELAERERALSDATDRAGTLAELYERDRTETNYTRSIVARDVASDAAKAVEIARTELRKAERHEKLAELRDGEQRLSIRATGARLRPLLDDTAAALDVAADRISEIERVLSERDDDRASLLQVATELREHVRIPAIDLAHARMAVNVLRGDRGGRDVSWFGHSVQFASRDQFRVTEDQAREIADRSTVETVVRPLLNG